MKNGAQQLVDLGFEKVGYWEDQAGRPTFRLIRHASLRKLLYAFVTGNDVKYVGKSTVSLEKRMHGYQNPGPTQHTNIRVRAKIAELLATGVAPEIWVFSGEPMTYRGFEVSLAAGLEDALVQRMAPGWNLRGK